MGARQDQFLNYARTSPPGTPSKFVPCFCIVAWFTSLPVLVVSPLLNSIDNRFAVPIVLLLAVGIPVFAIIWGVMLRRRISDQKGGDKLIDIPLMVNIVLLILAIGILVLVLPVYLKSFW